MKPLGWWLTCVDCGCEEICPDDALDAMGRPTPRDAGWLRDHDGWHCGDCTGIVPAGGVGLDAAR